MRKLIGFLGGLAVLGALAIVYMYTVALRDPLVREAKIVMPDWPKGAPPLRVALLADLHVGGPDMPPSRLLRIVRQVNALKPDLVLLAGDFISDKRFGWRSFGSKHLAWKRYDGVDALAPLAELKVPLGAFAVYGNHDHWRGLADINAGLKNAHVRLLENSAARVGPLSLGGSDDAFTGHDDVASTVRAMDDLPGAKLLFSHSPDVEPLVPSKITLVLAGHTHCGQIRLPIIGALSYESRYGARFGCGLARDGAKRVITTAGLGTSIVPLRLGAVPDMWLITLGSPEIRRAF